MTQAFNLSQLANLVNTSGQLNAATGLYNQVPVANGGTGKSSVTSGAFLIGAGTSAMTELTGTTPGTTVIASPTGWTSAPVASVAGGNYIMRTYTSPSPWTKPTTLKAVKVTVLGGGGNGGTAANGPAPTTGSKAGGGGSGAFASTYFDAPAITGPLTVSAGPGTNSFGPLVSCTGGANATPTGSSSTNGAGGAGGTATGGTISVNGFAGTPGSGTVLSTIAMPFGAGANSIFLGIGGDQNPGTTNANGGAARGYGAGGAGGSATQAINTTRTGGAGAPGIVIVEEFY